MGSVWAWAIDIIHFIDKIIHLLDKTVYLVDDFLIIYCLLAQMSYPHQSRGLKGSSNLSSPISWWTQLKCKASNEPFRVSIYLFICYLINQLIYYRWFLFFIEQSIYIYNFNLRTLKVLEPWLLHDWSSFYTLKNQMTFQFSCAMKSWFLFTSNWFPEITQHVFFLLSSETMSKYLHQYVYFYLVFSFHLCLLWATWL